MVPGLTFFNAGAAFGLRGPLPALAVRKADEIRVVGDASLLIEAPHARPLQRE